MWWYEILTSFFRCGQYANAARFIYLNRKLIFNLSAYLLLCEKDTKRHRICISIIFIWMEIFARKNIDVVPFRIFPFCVCSMLMNMAHASIRFFIMIAETTTKNTVDPYKKCPNAILDVLMPILLRFNEVCLHKTKHSCMKYSLTLIVFWLFDEARKRQRF